MTLPASVDLLAEPHRGQASWSRTAELGSKGSSYRMAWAIARLAAEEDPPPIPSQTAVEDPAATTRDPAVRR